MKTHRSIFNHFWLSHFPGKANCCLMGNVHTLLLIHLLSTRKCTSRNRGWHLKLGKRQIMISISADKTVLCYSLTTLICSKGIQKGYVAFKKMNSWHSSLLIPRGQFSTQKGRSVAGQGEAQGGSEHCVTLVYLLELMCLSLTAAVSLSSVCAPVSFFRSACWMVE